PGLVAGPDDDAADDVAGLDVAAGGRLLDAGDDHVAQPGDPPLVSRGAAAEDLEAHDFLGPGIVGHVEPGLHLDHGRSFRVADFPSGIENLKFQIWKLRSMSEDGPRRSALGRPGLLR